MKKYVVLMLLCIMLLFVISGCSISDDQNISSGYINEQPDSEQLATTNDNGSDSANSEELPVVAVPDSGKSENVPQYEAEASPLPSPADVLMEDMTARDKVGQLFVVYPEALDPGGHAVEFTDAMALSLQEYPVGGVIMFSANIASPEQITAFTGSLQSSSAIPLFISVDEEGGLVARLANNDEFQLPKYESAAHVGSTGDTQAAFDMGNTIGSYLALYGFNMDFAPVADVNTNPENTVIGSRAFSSDAASAASMASAMAEGLRQNGVIPVYKHFPGHGDTAEDSHTSVAVSYKSLDELWDCEWLPFLEAGDGDCVMVGHIALPEVTGTMIPAAMSPEIVTDILRDELGFDGLIVTDSLSMGAVTGLYTPGEAAVDAFLAGCDLLLIPADLPEAFEAVMAALEDGTISEERLDGSVRRILELKLSYGIITG